MRVWKDKKGEKLTTKEFIERWGEGIKAVTPLQQTTTQINSTWVMIIGIIGGLIITIKEIKTLWWLTLILAAAFFNTGMSLIGLLQRRKQLKGMDETYEEALKREEEEVEDDMQVKPMDVVKGRGSNTPLAIVNNDSPPADKEEDPEDEEMELVNIFPPLEKESYPNEEESESINEKEVEENGRGIRK